MGRGSTKASQNGNEDLTNDAATAEDAATAARLAPSPLTPVRKVTSTFVDLLSSASLQKRLRGIERDLGNFSAFRGQDVEAALALANEGKKLTAMADRLENSVARVHQRVVQINQKLRAFETALANCQQSAAEGSEVATALEGLVAARSDARGDVKRSRTVGKKRRARAAASKRA